MSAGTYLVQVGGEGGSRPSAASPTGSTTTRITDHWTTTARTAPGRLRRQQREHPSRRPSIPGNGIKENCVDDPPFPPDLDKDDDVVNDDIDCDDNNPAINQRAKEIRGNSVDEDCVGGPQDYHADRGALRYNTLRGHVVRFKYVRVFGIPAGATLRVRCRGKGCRGQEDLHPPLLEGSRRFDITKRVKQHRLRKGARLGDPRDSAGAIGRVFRIKALADGSSGSDRCLRPGAKKTIRCGADLGR